MSQITESDVKTEVGEWIDQNWDPELTVAQWWQLMADARLSHTMLSEEAGGRGWSRALNHVALSVMADKGVLGPPTGLGMMLAAPTLPHTVPMIRSESTSLKFLMASMHGVSFSLSRAPDQILLDCNAKQRKMEMNGLLMARRYGPQAAKLLIWGCS